MLRTGPASYTLPVVFHIVLQNPSAVTDAQIQQQLVVLNKAFAAENDQSDLVAGFRSRVGTTGIAFCLAQRTPNNLPSTGIVRYTTTRSSFDAQSDDVKLSARGGADAWDPTRFVNVWITSLQNGILGIGSFPGVDEMRFQGIVISTISLPGSTNSHFNGGKTLVHETGHFFNLYHIWGDDDGACTGSDDIEDTPNQADATNGSLTGVQTDACTTTAPGIMYQNYM
ncbi:MAG: M43 family zinc metalloprotease, partial [Flavihumibacter sp.]